MDCSRRTGLSNWLKDDLATLIEGLPIALAVTKLDKQRDVIYVNQQFTDSFGYTLEDIPTVYRWAELAYPDPDYRSKAFARWDAAIAAAQQGAGKIESLELNVTGKTGTAREVVLRAMVFDVYALVTFTDVSILRETQAALRSAEQQLQQTAYELTENIPVGTYTMVQPPDGGMAYFAFMSTRFLELTGLKREEAAADPMKGFACVHPDDFDEWVALNAAAFEKQAPFYGETRVVVDGKVNWISAESVPRKLPDGSTVWEGVLADITTRKAAERQLVENKQRAERLERAKSAFLANMSHEIRTPMNAVLGLTDLLMRDALEERQRDMVSRIQDAGELLLSIIDDVLDLSRIEAGKLVIRRRLFELNEVLERLRNLYQHVADSKGLVLELFPASGPVGQVLMGDPLRLEQVLGNLVGNAIKFTRQGRVQVSVDTVAQSNEQVRFRFNVSDTGIGLSESDQSGLFEPFTQADWADNESYPGTGLGLSISARLVRLMGGDIGVKSTLGKGSVFWVELPFGVAEGQSGVLRAADPRSMVDQQLLKGCRLLVVDDGELNRYLVQEFIEALGGECDAVNDGEQALAMLNDHPTLYSGVLMDVQMPILDGLETTRRLRKDSRFKALPIVAFTAGAMEEQREAALAAGMNDVLLKPLSLEQMAACFGRWCKQAMPEVPGIDIQHAAHTMEGNVALFERLLGIFREEFSTVLVDLKADLAKGDTASAQRRMHNICGSAAQIGALELAAVAGQVENAIEKEDFVDKQLMDLFEKSIKLVIPAIKTG